MLPFAGFYTQSNSLGIYTVPKETESNGNKNIHYSHVTYSDE